jgi:hypothetical protein
MNLRGTWYILPTPFTDDGTLDPASLTRLVEASVLWGVDGLTAMGVMGEPGALTAEERARALTAIADAARGRVPLAIGCSAASPGIVRELIEQARGFGAVAAMVAAPQLLRNVDQLPAFYAQVAALGLPPSSRTNQRPRACWRRSRRSSPVLRRAARGQSSWRIPRRLRRSAGSWRRARTSRSSAGWGRRRAQRAAPGSLWNDDRLCLPGDPTRRPRGGRTR